MTCIVGLVDKGRVYIGGDSAGIAGLSLTVRSDPKVFAIGEFVVGYTSSFRMGQLLRFKFQPPAIEGDLFAYMATHFVDALRECFKQGGYAEVCNGQESGGNFLVGVRGHLFHIQSDYQVGEALSQYDACGCGDDVACGALYATKGKGARYRIRTALEAAEQHSAGVRGPFVVLKTPVL